LTEPKYEPKGLHPGGKDEETSPNLIIDEDGEVIADINNYNPLKLYYYETNTVYLYGDGDRVAVHEGTDRV
jgi:hypothetical protein